MLSDRTEFGVRLPNSGPFATAENILRIAEHAETLEYDSVWVHDHLTWGRDKLTHFAAGSVEACRDQDPNFFESLTTATAVGRTTSRPKVGIAGMILPTREPRLLAKQLATVSQLIGPDRLVCAFGTGAMRADLDLVGAPWERRGRIANDYLAALRAILDGEQPVSVDTPSVSFTNGTFYPRPAGLALWVAGFSEAAQRRAARYADGWLVSPNGFRLGHEFEMDVYHSAIERLRRVLAEEGREGDDFAVALEIYVSVANTTEEAVNIAARSLEHRFKTVKKGLTESIVGDEQVLVDGLRRFYDEGARKFELKFICHDIPHMEAMMERARNAIARSDIAPASLIAGGR